MTKKFISGKDWYFVAVKIFLIDQSNRLLITKDKWKTWDLPGGRLKYNEFNRSLASVVGRKMREEIGGVVKYKLGKPAVFMRHQRAEKMPDGKTTKVRIFAIGYKAQYLGGAIKLGNNHTQFKWVDLVKFKPEKYFTGGWLKGVKEFQKFEYGKDFCRRKISR